MKISSDTFDVIHEAIWLYSNHIEHGKIIIKSKTKKEAIKDVETALDEIQGIGTY